MTRLTATLIIATFLACTLSFSDVSAQTKPGHVFTVRYHKVFPGKAGEYNTAYGDVIRPIMDKLKADGDIVSYLDLQEIFGDRDATHILIMEFENLDASQTQGPKLEAASQELFGKTFQEAVGDLDMLREYTGTEVFGSTQSN